MTAEKWTYWFDAASGIMHKSYFGEIFFDDFADSWRKAFEDETVPKGMRKFLIDYSDARFNIKTVEYVRIAEFYRQNIDFFKLARIAIVVVNHRDIVIPQLVETLDSGYVSKTFSSREAALNWLK